MRRELTLTAALCLASAVAAMAYAKNQSSIGVMITLTSSGACQVGQIIASQHNGLFVGTFVSAAACNGSQIVLSSFPAQPHGYMCHFDNQTTPQDAIVEISSTANSTTANAMTSANDVVGYLCAGY